MVWQRNDDQYGVSRKVTRIPRGDRLAAVGLDQLAKNYAVRALTDGVLDENELAEVLATSKLVDVLVAVGLWHRDGHDCERCAQPPPRGIVVHDFLEYNPSRSQVESQREAERVRKASQRDRSRTRAETPPGTQGGSDRPVPVPDPVPLTDVTHPAQESHESNAGAREDDDPITSVLTDRGISNLGRIRRAFASHVDPDATDGEIIDLATAVLDRSRTFVLSPEAYIEKAVRESSTEIAVYAAEVQGRSPRRLETVAS